MKLFPEIQQLKCEVLLLVVHESPLITVKSLEPEGEKKEKRLETFSKKTYTYQLDYSTYNFEC